MITREHRLSERGERRQLSRGGRDVGAAGARRGGSEARRRGRRADVGGRGRGGCGRCLGGSRADGCRGEAQCGQLEGATEYQLSSAKAAFDSVYTALEAAQAKRDQAYRGPKANAIEQARAAVRTAALQVEAAQIRLKNAQIIAPFDGVVGTVNAKAGEFFAPSAAAGAAIVLLTPDRLQLKMDVGETDYANLKKGQAGGVLFDSIPGKIYPFVISEIGLSPAVTQGVVTYQVKASLVLPADAPKPAPGMNARGQIITDSKPNLLVVPPRAIRKSGTDQVVDVRRDGSVVEQIVTTGVSDSAQIEIVTGLVEGEVVVVASLTSAKPGSTPKAQPTPPGNVR